MFLYLLVNYRIAEELLGGLLARQLTNFYQAVGGKMPGASRFTGMPPTI